MNKEEEKGKSYPEVKFLKLTYRNIKLLINNFLDHGGVLLAASISFFAILSIIPFLLVFTSIVGQIMESSQSALQQVLSFITTLFPKGGDDTVVFINSIISNRLTFGIMGGVIFYWAGSMAFQIAIVSIGRIYEHRGRFFLHQRLISFAVIPLLIVTFALFLGLSRGIVFLNNIVEGAKFEFFMEPLFSATSEILPVILGAGIFFLLYRLSSVKHTDNISALSGAAFTSVFTLIAKYLYEWFLSNFSQFGRIYGSLSAIVIALLWIYYVSIIFILGAEIVALMHKKRRKKIIQETE